MTNVDHANADIVRSDLTRLIIERVVSISGETVRDVVENFCDGMTTNELWAKAADYDLLRV